MKDIQALVDAMNYYFPLAMEETHTDLNRIYKSFGIHTTEKNNSATTQIDKLNLEYTQTTQQINKSEWDSCFSGKGTFDWDSLDF